MKEQLICSFSGIRGKVGKTLDFSQAYNVTLCFYEKYIRKEAYSKGIKIVLVVLGKDDKKSGDMIIRGVGEAIENIAKKEHRRIKLIYLGVTSTPMIGWAIRNYKATGGINITASHNPIEWNGIKLFSSDGMLLGKKEMEEIRHGILQSRIIAQRSDFRLTQTDISKQYNQDVTEKVKATIDLASGKKGRGREIFAKLKQSNFKVVIDACSKRSAEIPKEFLIQLGLRKKNIFVINSGSIEDSQRRLEPAPQYLGNLKKAIKKRKADIGFAFDPDQDRLVIMPLKSEEHTLLLCGKFLLELQKNNPHKFIKNIPVNLSTSSAWEDLADNYRISITRTKVGEINVAKAMQKNNSPFGGEGNGGVILKSVNCGRNSTVGIALILAYLSWTGKRIEELEQELPEYILIKSKLKISPGKNQKKMMDKIMARINGAVKNINRTDGYKIFFKDNSWIQLRPSNTEPIIRIFAEAKVSESRKKTIKRIKNIIDGVRS